MTTRTLVLAALAVSSFTLVGCVAPAADDLGEESVGESADAVHDTSQMTANGAPNTYRNLPASGSSVVVTGTPTGTIGYGNEFVTDEWVVEIDQTTNHGLTPLVTFQGPVTDNVTCSAGQLIGTVYGYVPALLDLQHHIIPAHWEFVTDVSAYGVWYSVIGNQGFCSYGGGNPNSLVLPHIAASKHYSLIRVGGAANYFGARVNVGVGAKAD